MKLISMMASAPLLSVLLWMPFNPPPGSPPTPMVGPSAVAGVDISNVDANWGQQPWVENEIAVDGDAPDNISQSTPYITVAVPGGTVSASKTAGITSTVVFYDNNSGSGPRSPLIFDFTMYVGDKAYTDYQHAHSFVSYAPEVADASLTGDDSMVANPQYLHDYSNSKLSHFKQDSDPNELRRSVDFTLGVSASNH